MGSSVRQAFRIIVREPGLAVTSIVTLAIGIGIIAAVFSVLDAVVVRPLPYSDPGSLVVVWQQDRTDGSPFTVSPANYLDWEHQASSFDSMAAVQQFSATDVSLAGAWQDRRSSRRFRFRDQRRLLPDDADPDCRGPRVRSTGPRKRAARGDS